MLLGDTDHRAISPNLGGFLERVTLLTIEAYPGKKIGGHLLRPDSAYFLDCLRLLFDQGGINLIVERIPMCAFEPQNSCGSKPLRSLFVPAEDTAW